MLSGTGTDTTNAANEGYHNKTTDFRSYFISFDGCARLELMHKPDMADEAKTLNRTGYIHIAFSASNIGKEKRSSGPTIVQWNTPCCAAPAPTANR